MATAKKTPATKAAPAKKAAPATKAAPAKKAAAPAKKIAATAPAKKAAPAKNNLDLKLSGDVGERFPDRDTAEAIAFGTFRRDDPVANGAGWADIFRQEWMHLHDLVHFFHRRMKNFFLGIQAGAQRPFVEQVHQRTRFNEPDVGGVG